MREEIGEVRKGGNRILTFGKSAIRIATSRGRRARASSASLEIT